jgi:lysozyme
LATAAAAGMSLVVFTATYLTAPWEAKRNVAYWDAIGGTWTACYGETVNIHQGDSFTDQQCMDMLLKHLDGSYLAPLRRCIAGFDQMPFSVQAAMLDDAYNVGAGLICISTAAKRAAAHNWAGTCDALAWFNKAGGRVIPGLDRRRKDGDAQRMGEHEICIAGIPS